MGYTLNGYERETIITYNEAEKDAVIYTASPVIMRKLEKLEARNPELFREEVHERQFYQGELVSKRWKFPKDLLTIRSGYVRMTEEQRARNAERLEAARMAKFAANVSSE